MNALGIHLVAISDVLYEGVKRVKGKVPKEFRPPRGRELEFVPFELTPEILRTLISKKEEKIITKLTEEHYNSKINYVFPNVSKETAEKSIVFEDAKTVFVWRGGRKLTPAKAGVITVEVPTAKGIVELRITPYGEFRRALRRLPKKVQKKRLEEFKKYLPFMVEFYREYANIPKVTGVPVIKDVSVTQLAPLTKAIIGKVMDDDDIINNLMLFSSVAERVIKKNGGKTIIKFTGEPPIKDDPPMVFNPIVAYLVSTSRTKNFYSAIISYNLDESRKLGTPVGVVEFTMPGKPPKTVKVNL